MEKPSELLEQIAKKGNLRMLAGATTDILKVCSFLNQCYTLIGVKKSLAAVRRE